MEITVFLDFPVNNVRTVSDTKRAFYTLHTRPINSIYRRVVEELMVEMHLLSVNADFRYDSIYALGVVTTFDRFMQGYRPEGDKDSIFNALCRAIEDDPQRYQHSAEQIRSEAVNLSVNDFVAQVKQLSTPNSDVQGVAAQFRPIFENQQFKYSRLFAIGVYSLLEIMSPDLVKDEKQRNDVLQQIMEPLGAPVEKVQKDLELYRSNLEKLVQAQAVMEDILKADRKKKEERARAKDAIATPPNNSPEST
jgi:photosystem II biogenesis protein Psp29